MSGLGGDDDPHLSRDPDRRRRDPLRHRHASRRRGRRRLVALVVALAAAVVAIWFCLSLLQPFPGDGRGAVTVVVPSGASAKQVGDLLDGSRRGLIELLLRPACADRGQARRPASRHVHAAKNMSYGGRLDG